MILHTADILLRFRQLRVGETILPTDLVPNGVGELLPPRRGMVGHTVLGERSAPGNADIVYRERKRSKSAP